ncbi:uncharacterized protein LOC126986466 isoform X2 [Eriocheir sinensis]|uniref:uncharacterized protein LOC126986466 isoform X2 n=1 Tax=Eriocheir sinensis TaxID=95602 RepID=UPI0021C7B3FD|nr:uncharacterized protein LOC126986466 isoform X2 [Eriocheir sinensis]
MAHNTKPRLLLLLLQPLLLLLLLPSPAQASDYYDVYDYDYSYGDERFLYDDNQRALPEMPLCCPLDTIYEVGQNCSSPPAGWEWRPQLSGEPAANFMYTGFPKCKVGEPVPFHQKDVFFNDGEAFVPNFIQLDPIPKEKYCVAKVYDRADPEECEVHRTKVFVCLEKKQEEPGLYWTGVGIAHTLLFLTLLSFFSVRDLRCLQGQYMICFLISLLVYNICLLPGSVLILSISFVSCVSLGAVKYFFFCGVMLWFNVICFDVWRTMKNRQDVGSRRRFLLYSVYTWVVGAVLTTAVLVVPYLSGKTHDSALMEPNTAHCKLRTDINMILQLVEVLLMLVNLVFLSLAASHICRYPKFGNGLQRCDASLSLKQGWKLYIIMICHTLIDVPDDIFTIKVVDLWRYVLVESLALFAVFAYRKSVLRHLHQTLCCGRCSPRAPDEEEANGAIPEKHQLTTTH